MSLKKINIRVLYQPLLIVGIIGFNLDNPVLAEENLANNATHFDAIAQTMGEFGLTFGGWLNLGVSINPDQPDNHYNGPLGFSDRANELQLNQLYGYLEKITQRNGQTWDIGGRLDFIFGSDAFYTRSMGDPADHWDSHLLHNKIYGIAFPQVYLEFNVPIGEGLNVKLGEFYTLIGSETVTAPDNFFYSRSYQMQFAEPFSHTGLLAQYRFNEFVELSAGATTGSPYAGWDGSFQHELENWGFLGQMHLSFSETGTDLAVSATHGTQAEYESSDINMYSLVLKQSLGHNWSLTLQHDYGWQDAHTASSSAQWYGVLGLLQFKAHASLDLGLRVEWFRDDDGQRVGVPARQPIETGYDSNYYAATFGLNWKPRTWLTVRPSFRYDVSDDWKAFDSGGSKQQFLISADVLMHF